MTCSICTEIWTFMSNVSSMQVHLACLQGGASWPMENYFQAEAFNLDKVLDEFEQNEGEPPLLPPPPLHWRLYGRSHEQIKFWGSCGLDALTQAASKSDNQPLLSEFEQRSQVVIEGVWGGNWTNWTIHLPGASGKLCYQSKTKGGDLFFSTHTCC